MPLLLLARVPVAGKNGDNEAAENPTTRDGGNLSNEERVPDLDAHWCPSARMGFITLDRSPAAVGEITSEVG